VPRARVGAGDLTGHVVPRPGRARRLAGRSVGVHVVPRASVHAVGLACLVLPCSSRARNLIHRAVCADVVPRARVHAAGLARLVLPFPSRALGRRVGPPEGNVPAGRGCFAGAPCGRTELAGWAWQVEAGLLVEVRGVPLDPGQPVVG